MLGTKAEVFHYHLENSQDKLLSINYVVEDTSLWRTPRVPSFMTCRHGLKSPGIHAWSGPIAICCLLYTSDAADDM
eukprot:3199369-Prorocentrum_lima.AAC.1